MKATGYFTTEARTFYVKPIRGGYYGVYNNYDKSLESLCLSKEEADNTALELNNLRN